MKNFKLENNLIGDKNWPEIASVYVAGNKKAMPINPEKDEEYNEAVIQSWDKIVVLHAMAPKPTKFHIGFTDKFVTKYLKYDFVTDLKFAMRVGPKNFQIIALPKNMEDKIMLEVVEYTTENDEKYKDLILI
ncbi:MAG: hypothetical protein US63_C0026G0006 [Candidatus Moranbacteria bacterium GW2011_GWC2_37_8]|nr:MAG: hypothetical protein US63_C0026G0006 [Candidatus Moranbacteria bacterium GW2011_GWC2_37_8]KKQ62889.1 MAG: hypothetical protein US82_C0004G0006 [Parcubacteria group bacterium GW2011_GWC1_38_22]KKQ81481.1 MAG: hypothetical protein UT03_C0001G0021 [Candidatus Moranbacteria bacterium GW2011_GWD2_38_7]